MLKATALGGSGPEYTPGPHLHCLAGPIYADCPEWLPPDVALEHVCAGSPDTACLLGSPAHMGDNQCPLALSAASGSSVSCKSSSVNTEHSE